MEVIESHLKWAITNDASKEYDVVALLEPTSGTLVDVYYHPYPRNLELFNSYRPFPRDDIFYGESMCELLGQSQEEASRIHNERRDNSTIASAVCFKRRNGSNLPNPSTNWYPGKVWDLEDLGDLEAFQIGRNYDDMLPQEQFTLQLAQQLVGMSADMQGSAQGQLDKRGVYNTSGTLSVIAEGNQRQDTNLRDLRMAIADIAKTACHLQAFYGKNDPYVSTLPPSVQAQVQQAFQIFADPKYRYLSMEIKSSGAGSNSEIRKANLMMMGNTLAQYGQMAIQMSTQLSNPQMNPVIRDVMTKTVQMQKWLATRLLKEIDEWDETEVIPDVLAAIQKYLPGASGGSQQAGNQGGQGNMVNGGSQFPSPVLPRSNLESVASIPEQPGGNVTQ
jgi:hypothetical protein